MLYGNIFYYILTHLSPLIVYLLESIGVNWWCS